MPRKPAPDPIKHCERCGVLLRRKRYGKDLEDMARFLVRKFCSLRCANSRGIRSLSSSSQHRISQQFRKPRCESCGRTPRSMKQLHVHHLNGNWRDHRLENLRTVCIRCHLQEEHRKPPTLCVVCGATSRRLKMCQKHYQRWKKHGDPLLTLKRKAGTSSGYVLVRESS